MKIPFYHIDAFTGRVFSGNPAGVCPLESWLDDVLLQRIAAENNLSETAFFVADGDAFHIRWFAPLGEVDLCGHATLATAFTIFSFLGFPGGTIRFRSKSGELTVTRKGEVLSLDFPAQSPEPCVIPPELPAGLGVTPLEVFAAQDYLAILPDEKTVRGISPDFETLRRLDRRGVIVTAPGGGGGVDFVSRCFYPKLGVGEDPATGSAHCTLVPYWSSRLGKRDFHAMQVSARGGELFCADNGDRVRISGRAVKFLEGMIEV